MAVYDDQDTNLKTRADDDELRRITGINPADEKAMEARAHEDEPSPEANEQDALKRQTGNDIDPDQKEKEAGGGKDDDKSEDNDGNWDTNVGGDAGKKSLRARFVNKKSAVISSVIGTVLAGSLGILFILPGTELQQLSAALGKHDRPQTSVVDSRINRMVRRSLLKNADDRLVLARSRLGFVQNRVFGSMLDRLESQHGIRIAETSGRVTGASRPTIEFNLPEGHPLRGRTGTLTRLNIARDLGIPAAKLGVDTIGTNGSFTVSQLDLTTAELDGVKTWLAKNTGGGGITRFNADVAVAMNKRLFSKTLRLPSLFNPVSRASEAAGRKVDNFVEARRARKQANAQKSRVSEEVKRRTLGARSLLKSRVGTNVMRTAGAAVAIQGVMCMVKDIASIIPDIYFASVVTPAMIRSIQMKSAASKQQSGIDISTQLVGDTTADLKDKDGRTVWGAQALNALLYGGVGVGAAIDIGARSAFTTSGSSIAGLTEALGFDEVAGMDIADSVAGWACSWPARVAGIVVGVTVTAAGVVAGVVTGGTTTAGAVGRVAVQASIAGAISYTASRILGEFIEGKVEGKVADVCGVEFDGGEGSAPEDIEILNAEAFGNCLAYASRVESNINASSMGGVPLSASEERTMLNHIQEQEIAEFKQKGLGERLFDPTDSRSLMMAAIGPGTLSNMANTASSMAANIAKIPAVLIGNVASLFSPPAQAQTGLELYDWGIPITAFPLKLANDPRYDSPENVRWAVDNPDDIDKERVKKCFAVEIVGTGKDEKDPIKTIPLDKEVNPLSDNYNDAKCGELYDDEGNENESWIRTALIAVDDAIARIWDCWDESKGACGEIGMGVGGPSVGTVDCSSAVGNEKIVCAAQNFFGIKYDNDFGRSGGLHGGNDAEAWLSRNPTLAQQQSAGIDCSGFTNLALYAAFGYKTSAGCSGRYALDSDGDGYSDADPNFKIIPINEVRPGDFLTISLACDGETPGHVGIFAGVLPNGKWSTVESSAGKNTSGEKTSGFYEKKAGPGDGPHDWKYAVRYVGPGGTP